MQALDLRRQEQIRRQRESIDRMLVQLQTVHKVIWDPDSRILTGPQLLEELQKVVPYNGLRREG